MVVEEPGHMRPVYRLFRDRGSANMAPCTARREIACRNAPQRHLQPWWRATGFHPGEARIDAMKIVVEKRLRPMFLQFKSASVPGDLHVLSSRFSAPNLNRLTGPVTVRPARVDVMLASGIDWIGTATS